MGKSNPHQEPCHIPDCNMPWKARGLCNKHLQRWSRWGDPFYSGQIRGDDLARFYDKTVVDPDDVDACWGWSAGLTDRGYALFVYPGGTRASRFSYGQFVGPIPEDFEVDHLCRNRACTNWRHLEAVTHEENQKRRDEARIPQTHCKYGHEFTPENTYIWNGIRQCRTCHRRNARKSQRKRGAS